MERFARLVVAGGVGLVAGLWMTALSPLWGPLWLGGVGLALVATVALGAGIWIELDVGVTGA